MAFEIYIDPQAKKEIQQAISYYEHQQKGLGKKFHSALKTTLKRLTTHPFLSIRYKDIRMVMVARYPYAVHFSIDESKQIVSIWGVIHTSQDPDRNWVWNK
jgi:toxin ParE1/3/4